jgi:hypothetical protein
MLQRILTEGKSMPAFRRVVDHRAGPSALGILVPPGQRTVVILRPRALEWDLLPAQSEPGAAFCAFGREEAALLARQVAQALERGAGAGPKAAAVVANPAGAGFLVRVHTLDLFWIVCLRAPGRPYQPHVFPSRDEAQAAFHRLIPFLWPNADADQEYYFNTQNFDARESAR